MRNGAVGSSWNAERNTVNVKPHITKKRGVNNRPDMNREVYVVGVIADTHGLVRPGIAAAFAGVRLILHAGDVGGPAVLEALAKLAPVDAVYGNVDDRRDPSLARERVVTIGGVTIHVSHGHELGQPTPQLALARYQGDVVIFGHTHRAIVVRDQQGRIGMNPGAAGPRRFDLAPSVARLTITSSGSDGTPAETAVEIIPVA
jgi:putative phosphoesterase